MSCVFKRKIVAQLRVVRAGQAIGCRLRSRSPEQPFRLTAFFGTPLPIYGSDSALLICQFGSVCKSFSVAVEADARLPASGPAPVGYSGTSVI